ncbi:MAG: phosphodiester glycosidase family protein [Staphylococcus equorum]
MSRLQENLPYSLNNEFRGYLVSNFKTLNKDKHYVSELIEKHKKHELNAHTSKQINHNGKTLDEMLNVLESRMNNQIQGVNKNSSSEVKDIRVGIDGTIHELAQNRLMKDLDKINSIAREAEEIAELNEKQIRESAYYNEIDYIKGRMFDTDYYIVHIPYRDEQGDIIKLKKGISGNNPNKPIHMKPTKYAKEKGATFVSNASTGSSSQSKLHGQQIFNGEILDSVKSNEYDKLSNRWTLAIDDDNLMTAFPQNITAQQIKEKGYNNTFSGFGPLIMEGKVIYSKGDYSEHSEQPHPRTVIFQLPNRDSLVFTCEGRSKAEGLYQKGMTLNEVIETLYNHYGDISFAYSLDGGGSSSSVLRSKMLNKPTDKDNKEEREVLDFLYIGKKQKQIRDRDIQKAYEDIGELKSELQFLYGTLINFNKINAQELFLNTYNDYTGIVAADGDEPKKKIYMNDYGFRFFDYNSGSNFLRITDEVMQLHGRVMARKFSAPETMNNCNKISIGGDYLVQSDAIGAPYPTQSSAIITHYNVTYTKLEDAYNAFQTAVPFARTQNLRMKRRSYVDGEWSQWFDV